MSEIQQCSGCAILRRQVGIEERRASEARIALSQLRGHVRHIKAYMDSGSTVPDEVWQRLFEAVPPVGEA